MELIIFGIITALLALYLAYRANRLSSKSIRLTEKIAASDGTFKKPLLSVNIGIGNKMFENIHFVTYVLPFHGSPKLIEVPFTYAIDNSGDGLSSDLEFYVDFPNNIHPNKSIGLEMTYSSKMIETIESKETMHEDGYKLHTVGHKIGSIAPEGSIGIRTSLLFNSSTKVITKVKVKSKDGKNIIAKVSGDFHYVVSFKITSHKAVLLEKTIAISVIASKEYSEKSFLENQKKHLQENAEKYYSKYGETIGGLVISSKSNKLYYSDTKLLYQMTDFESKCYETKMFRPR